MKTTSKLKTFLLCCVFAAVFILSMHLAGFALDFITEQPDDNGNIYMPQLQTEIFGIAAALIIMKITGKLGVLKERGKGILIGLFVGLYMICLSFFALFGNLVSLSVLSGTMPKLRPASHIITFAVCMLSVGIAEEFMFRGVIQNCLMDRFGRDTKKNTFISLFLSAAIFGLIHLSNVFSGVTFKGALIQAIAVIGAGFYMGAIYVRCGNIWVNVLLHAFLDFAGLSATGILFDKGKITDSISETSPLSIIGGAIYLCVGIFLLRRSQVKYTDNKVKVSVNATDNS